jgi:methylenetetrahydrofolate reductase (NADPH)
VEWAIEQCRELISSGIPCLHFYTMGNSATCRRVAEKVY